MCALLEICHKPLHFKKVISTNMSTTPGRTCTILVLYILYRVTVNIIYIIILLTGNHFGPISSSPAPISLSAGLIVGLVGVPLWYTGHFSS